MKKLLKLGETLSTANQKTINGGFGGGCNIFICTPETEGCVCYDNPNSPDGSGRGYCMDGMCCD